MDNQFNTIAGWALGAGIAALGLTIVTGEYFRQGHVEKGGYHVESAAGASEGGAAAEVPIATLMQTADAAKGAEVFKKCGSCHTIAAGGANGIGPNLHGVMGKGKGKVGGFAYSAGLLAKGGNWDFEAMNSWLHAPKKFVEGTKMSFAGLGKGEDRANLIAYLNSEGSNLPMPAAPAAAPVAAETAAAAPAAPAAK
ncbi:MAG: cytochrome c family protein [Chakrabartia sp.]